MPNTGKGILPVPTVRVPTVPGSESAEGGTVAETPIVDLPPSEKFGFAWPDKPGTTVTSPTIAADDRESDVDTSDVESQVSRESGSPPVGEKGDSTSTGTTPTGEVPSATTPPLGQSPPRLSRAFSMPLSSRLGNLRNPHRLMDSANFPLPSPLALSEPPHASNLQELSVELADSVQMVIQTLLQISPPHLLDPAKEQFSACSLSVPSPSISAMLTAMKNLNYMSANISAFGETARLPAVLQAEAMGIRTDSPPAEEDFDIGETLQSVGDSLSGLAAQAGVELVLFHGDVGMKHVSVRGDEGGLSYALSHIIRQVLDTAHAGDTIEIGLFITAERSNQKEPTSSQESLDNDGELGESRSSSRASSSAPYFDDPLRCVFHVGHKFATGDLSSAVMANNPLVTSATSLFRAKPRLDTIFFRRILSRVNGSIKEDIQPRLFSPGRACDLTVLLDAGSPDLLSEPPNLSVEEEALRQPYASMNIQLASEPSLEELQRFVGSLRGRKAALHASAKGSFAHHLTSYLTAWGMDVSHVSTSESDVREDGSDTQSEDSREEIYRLSPTTAISESPAPVEVNPIEENMRERVVDSSPSFILIDDDVKVLRQRLLQLRSEQSFNLNLKRPKLAAHHRPKSSPQIMRAKAGRQGSMVFNQQSPHPVIVHFTSLQNFKIVKDLIHSILSTPSPSNLIPEVIVLPKPAGPRRLLTALRTAIVKPIVDPFFTPIATSPMSPGGNGFNPFTPFNGNISPLQRVTRPAISPRTSDRSQRPTRDSAEVVQRLPPSPLRDSESLEYFSEAAVKLGTSPSSGLVIQSPDGQPAGIFFQPRRASQSPHHAESGSSSLVQPASMVRDQGNLRPPVRRSSLSRRSSNQVPSEGASGSGDRGKRPASLSRTRSSLHHITEDMSESNEASADERPLQRPAQDFGPLVETLAGMRISSTAPTPPAPITTGMSDAEIAYRDSTMERRASMSPPVSPGSARAGGSPGVSSQTRRGVRKGTGESVGTPTARKGKLSADGNIIPPVNVLIVEDNPINQTILSTFMKKKKIKYAVAKNGLEAVQKWKEGGFHLILMDIQMPVMDGIEATKEIRHLERQAHAVNFPSTPPDGQQTPSEAPSETKSNASNQTPYRSSVIIVALTASSLQADRVAALAAGCNDFLTKPVGLEWLNSKIIEWGSIKALQMWADLRPEVVKNISHGQTSQARSIASKLHVPENRRVDRSGISISSRREGPSQMDAIRMLANIPSPSRDSDSDPMTPATRHRAPVLIATASSDPQPSPLSNIGNESSSGSSSAPSKNTPEENAEKEALAPPITVEVSGEEALRRHLEDTAQEVSSAVDREFLQQPTVLGERSLSSGQASIAEVMHDSSDSSPGPGPDIASEEIEPDAEPEHEHEPEPSTTDHESEPSAPPSEEAKPDISSDASPPADAQ